MKRRISSIKSSVKRKRSDYFFQAQGMQAEQQNKENKAKKERKGGKGKSKGGKRLSRQGEKKE